MAKFDSEFELKCLQLFGILEAKAWFKSNWMRPWNEILVVQLEPYSLCSKKKMQLSLPKKSNNIHFDQICIK